MVRFDWEKILKETDGNIGDILTIFQRLTFNDLPESYSDPLNRFIEKDFYGYSFLVNGVDLIIAAELERYSPEEIVEYIAVASLRNIHRFWDYKEVFLSTQYFPGDLTLLKGNRLIKVDEDKILFKYEFDRN